MNIRPSPPRRCWFLAATLLAALLFPACAPETPSANADPYPDQKLKGPNNGRSDKGVVLAYRKGVMPADGKPVDISVRQTLVVRVRNLDGWLIEKLTDNRITGEPAMTAEQRRNYVLLLELKGEENGEKFLKRYEEAAASAATAAAAPPIAPAIPPTAPNPAAPVAPAVTTPAAPGAAPVAPPALKPLPAGVTAKKLRDAKNAFDSLLNTVKRQLFPVINNSYLRHLKPENPDSGTVNLVVKAEPGMTVHEFEFRLRRLPGDEDAWSSLYDGTRAIHSVRLSVGFELDQRVFVLDSAVFPQADAPVQRLRLELFSENWLIGVLATLALVLVAIIALGASTALLRDTDLPLRADGCPQFSLSRLQLAFWTFLVVGAFLVIWLVTDRLDTLNTTILALLGISSATTLASKLTSSLTLTGGATPAEPKRAARRDRSIPELIAMIDEELKELEAAADGLEKERLANPSPELDRRAERLTVRIARLKEDRDYLGRNPVTRFCIDLLAENGRVTLHRLQIIVWTIVLGVVFIARVGKELSMPVFSETLLGLMGLSSLTYVALKVPEMKRIERDVKTEPPDAR